MPDKTYQALVEHSRRIGLLDSIGGILSWDQEVMMPECGITHRARQMEHLAGITHELRIDPRIAEWLSICKARSTLMDDPVKAGNLREWRRRHDRARRLPGELVAKLAETTSLAQHHWAKARQDADFAAFLPWLTQLVSLIREKAACLVSDDHQEPYDALMDEFEPGLRSGDLDRLFTPLRASLTGLLDRARGRGHAVAARVPRTLAIPRQETFVHEIAGALGFDFTRGRLDRSTHPFCGGSHCDDVRITTRYRADDLLDGLGSMIHEVGHGLYEQGLPAEHIGTPCGDAVSLGMHESQSRLWENHVGRSLSFWQFAAPLLQSRLEGPLDPSQVSPEAWWTAANVVAPGLIRVDADEVTYNLHIMVRCDLERALLRGTLDPKDLPEAWNAGYQDLLSLTIKDDRVGCLQDVHWSCGLFGYFPTYTLGNLYAAQLFDAAKVALPDLDAQIARGEFALLRQWLTQSIHQYGSREPAAALCLRATGRALGPEPFLAHLEQKVADLEQIKD